MVLQQEFEKNLNKLGVEASKHRILVAVSGGVDSMVLLQMFIEAGFDVGVAHVNFGLRAAESDGDEHLVRDFCREKALPFFTIRAATLSVADKEGISIQMAARKIRYDFFKTIKQEHHFDFIATAHHADDELENLFIYLLRNNTNAAFSGIEPMGNDIIRPLLPFDRNSILEYALEQELIWREDSSNLKTDYLRNKVRHWIIPGLKEEYPDVLKEYSHIASEFSQRQKNLKRKWAEMEKENTVEMGKGEKKISFNIRLIKGYEGFMQWYLHGLGFHKNAVKEIMEAERTGATYASDNHTVNVERDGWRIVNKSVAENFVWEGYRRTDLPIEIVHGTITFSFFLQSNTGDINFKNTWYFDADEIQFPIEIRTWQMGDRMTVFGMKGSKKLSDIFTDAKVENIEKNRTPVIWSGDQILALPPYRRSNVAPVTDRTKELLCLHWQKNDE